MNQEFSSGSMLGYFSILTGLASLLLTVYWVVVSWRALRALESIASTLREPPPE